MATRKTTAPKPAKGAAAPTETPAAGDAQTADAAPKVRAPSLKIKELVDRVATASGGKKKDVKAIVEATLAALGDALGKGEDFNLPGLGRTRIARTAEKDGASMLTLKVKRGPHRRKEAKEPLADEEDDG